MLSVVSLLLQPVPVQAQGRFVCQSIDGNPSPPTMPNQQQRECIQQELLNRTFENLINCGHDSSVQFICSSGRCLEFLSGIYERCNATLPFCPEGSGSSIAPIGSGSDDTPENIVPVTVSCAVLRQQVVVEIFRDLSSLFLPFDCCITSRDIPLLFVMMFPGRNPIYFTEGQLFSSLVAEYFQMGDHQVSIDVCAQGRDRNCDPDVERVDIGAVALSVIPNTFRHFPYGTLTRDRSFRNVLDGARPIYPPDSIPFFSNYHRVIYVSTNGLVSFGRPYLSWWPIPFPFGYSRVPVIAPFWADFDFRNIIPATSRVYYNAYDRRSSSILHQAILEEFELRMPGSDFMAEWMAVITWEDAVPYHWRYNYREQANFQLILATDYVQTQALFIYRSSSLDLPRWQRVVVGYDARDFIHYHTLQLPSSSDFFQLHATEGNTGRVGEWHYSFTLPQEQLTADQRCLMWAKRQRISHEENLQGFSSLRERACPCTFNQAQRDRSFWFLYYWGLNSRRNCAMVPFSGNQSTLECCYDTSGALIVGPNEGGSFWLYNPLFFYQENFIQDLQPYRDCCVDSDRCQLYYTYRPSDDCSAYEPPRFQFTSGDPHFLSVDGKNFTFNGIGEYIFVRTPASLGFSVQGRLRAFSGNVTGTVLSSIVVKQGATPPVQITVEDSELKV